MATSAVDRIRDEPRVVAPAAIPLWDRLLAVVLVPAAVVEGLVRTDVPWPAWSILFAMVCPLALLWRSHHPLAMLLLGYGAQTLAGVGPSLAGEGYGVLSVTSCVLLFPYSLGRWGSGRAVLIGLVALLTMHLAREPLYDSSGISILVGVGFLLLPAATGLAVRFWGRARRRENEHIRSSERVQLARELHDTVAHYVSGILVQAQAGQAVAATDPARALEVLGTVEKEAKRSLVAMRSLVEILRERDEPERSPAQGIADLAGLVRESLGPAAVDLTVSGDVQQLGSPVDAAVYRLVMESLTNARRHARGASLIRIAVVGEPEAVRITVTDDGRQSATSSMERNASYGLVGMTERVELLGGSFQAGPTAHRGWQVSAVIPRPEESP